MPRDVGYDFVDVTALNTAVPVATPPRATACSRGPSMFRLKYELRRGRPADARIVRKVLLSILREHGLTPIEAKPDAEITTFAASDPSRDDFVAVSDGKVVGFLIMVPLGGAGHLTNIFVARSHRGRGVGTMLIARAMETAKTRGYVSLHLSTMEAFATARAYYERHGWVRESVDGADSILYAIRIA